MRMRQFDVKLTTMITCPHCGHVEREVMPSEGTQWFYECKSCQGLLSPKPGDCCVFCSYGDTRCPSVQARGG